MNEHRGQIPSAVNLVSNAISLAGLDGDDVMRLFHPGRFPDRLLPSVLHETAHWDTFSTPVGHALTIAFLRSWRRTQVPSEHNEYESAMDLTRYRFFYEMLRPLSEGLALFCEFDIQPGDSPVTSAPTLLAGLMFGDRKFADDRPNLTLGQLAKLNLTVARQHPIFHSRKENLLCQNFSLADGGYLPGYFFIKNLRNYLVSRRRLFELLDGDLFFYVIRAAIFGDIHLARLIVDPTLDFIYSSDAEDAHNDTINAVLQRFQHLLEFAVHDLNNDYVDAVAEVTVRDGWTWADLPQSVPSRHSKESDIDVISEETAALIDPKTSDAAGEAARVCNEFLVNRSLMCLGTLETRIQVNQHGRCIIGSREKSGVMVPHASIPALPDIGVHDGIGTYEIYLDRTAGERRLLFSVVVDETCVACGCVNSDTPIDVSDFAARRPSMASAAKLCGRMDDELDASLGDHPFVEHFESQQASLTWSIYDRYCGALFSLAGGDEEKLSVPLLDLAESDLAFIAEYSALSLVNGGLFSTDTFKEACEDLKIDQTVFFKKIKDWKDDKRFALHESFGEMLQLTF